MLNFANQAHAVQSGEDNVVLPPLELLVGFNLAYAGDFMKWRLVLRIEFPAFLEQRDCNLAIAGDCLSGHGPVPVLENVQRQECLREQHCVGQWKYRNYHFEKNSIQYFRRRFEFT
jgi:hypothetical protein